MILEQQFLSACNFTDFDNFLALDICCLYGLMVIRTKDGKYIKFEEDIDLITQLELVQPLTFGGFWHYPSNIFDKFDDQEVKDISFNSYLWNWGHNNV